MLYTNEIKDNKINQFTENKKFADELGWTVKVSEDEVEKAYNGCWYIKGYAPVKPEPTVEEQNEEIRQTRQQAYIETSDPLYMDYQESLARGEETAEEKKQLWLSAKDKIREENPYVVDNPENLDKTK